MAKQTNTNSKKKKNSIFLSLIKPCKVHINIILGKQNLCSTFIPKEHILGNETVLKKVKYFHFEIPL